VPREKPREDERLKGEEGERQLTLESSIEGDECHWVSIAHLENPGIERSRQESRGEMGVSVKWEEKEDAERNMEQR
jgi:hypothetical protein